jgi:hypothetical protein
MEVKRIKFPVNVNPRSFEKLVVKPLNAILAEANIAYRSGTDFELYLEKIKGSCSGIDIILDLRDVNYIGLHEALNIILLGEFLYWLKSDNVKIFMPTSKPARKFLSTFGFFRYLESWGMSLSGGRLDDDVDFVSGRLLRITRIDSADDIGTIADSLKVAQIARILRKMFGKKSNKLSDCILTEVCQNVPEHSRRNIRGHGYCAVQVHPATERWTKNYDVHNTVEVAVVDGGIGIKQSLRYRHPKLFTYRTASACIMDVLTKGTPQDGIRERAGLLKVMKSSNQDFGANLRLRSVNGFVQITPDRGVHKSATVPFFPGTQFRLLLPIEERQHI